MKAEISVRFNVVGISQAAVRIFRALMRQNYLFPTLFLFFFCRYLNQPIDFPAVLLPVKSLRCVVSLVCLKSWDLLQVPICCMEVYTNFQGSGGFFLASKAVSSNGAGISGKGNLKMQNSVLQKQLVFQIRQNDPLTSRSEKYRVPPQRGFV